MDENGVAPQWRMPHEMWQRIEPLVPRLRKHRKGGRPWIDNRRIADGIFYVLRTGCQWKAVPREFGSGSTLHRRFQHWVKAGVFRRLWKAGLLEYDKRKGIQWDWQALDGAMTKAPLGGKKNGSSGISGEGHRDCRSRSAQVNSRQCVMRDSRRRASASAGCSLLPQEVGWPGRRTSSTVTRDGLWSRVESDRNRRFSARNSRMNR